MDKSKWEYKKLEVDNLPIGDVFDIFMGRTPSRDDLSLWEDGSHEWVSIGDMGTTKYISDTKEKVSDKACTNMRLVPKDTVIMSFKLSIGKVAITEIPLYTNEAIMAFPPKSGYNISPNYLYYHLQAYKWQSANRAVMGKTLNKAVISSSRITIPDSETQQRIVAELDCLNEMIALKQEQLKEFDKLAQSIFYDMFGDPGDNVHEWEISILEDVVSENCSISYGIVQPGDDVENGVPVVRPVDLVNQIVYRDGLKIVDKAISDSYKRTILNGDELLFCVRGTTGIISFASEELEGCNVTRGITPLEFADRIDKYYAYYLLKTPYLQSLIAEKTNGIALKQINMRDVRLLPIMCPPLALQQQFAEKIQAIEAQKELVKQSIAETQQLLDSRMDYYFD